MNSIWLLLLLVSSIVVGIKDISQFNEIIMTVGEDVVHIAIPLIASTCFFNGWLYVAMKCGLVQKMTSLLHPIFRIIFPELKNEANALSFITSNIVMNMLGLGSAATSSGLMAMKELDKLNQHKETASRSMRTFVIMNTAGITLFSATVAGLRTEYGSATPFSHLPFAFFSSFIAFVVVLLLDRISNRYE